MVDDFRNLEKKVEELGKADADILHIDIMEVLYSEFWHGL